MDDYFRTMGMQFVAGHVFSGNPAADSTSVILNEAAVKRLRLKDPVGQLLEMYSGTRLKVIGVVKDALILTPFNQRSVSNR